MVIKKIKLICIKNLIRALLVLFLVNKNAHIFSPQKKKDTTFFPSNKFKKNSLMQLILFVSFECFPFIVMVTKNEKNNLQLPSGKMFMWMAK